MPAPPQFGRHDVGPERAGQAADTDQVQAQGRSSSGNGYTLAVVALVALVNLHLDPDLGWPVRPYLGGGIGAAYVSLDTGDVDDVTSHEVLVGLRYTF
jgi:opacity protein-like surface antigen